MEKIRITFVETNCKKNGPIKQTLNIIQHMDREIFEPSLITIWREEPDNSMVDEYTKLGIPVYCCGLSKKKSIFIGRKAVTEYLNKLDPDIVQGVGMPPYRMSLGYKNAVHFETLRNYCYEDYPNQYGKVIGPVLAYMDLKLIRKQQRRGEPFVTCSESLSKMYYSRQNLEFHFIRNGVNVSQYRKRDMGQVGTLRAKLGLPNDKKIFVYSGGLIGRKNQAEAIQAFKKMAQNEAAVLVLLGDGPDRQELERLADNSKNILFCGKVSNVEEYLHASDAYIATSKSEGLPNGVLEAMACGLPVLLSNIPQHLEVMEPDPHCGYTYELGDVAKLTFLLDQMVDDDLVAMGEVSYRAVMDNFTAEGMSQKYQDAYRKCLSGEEDR